MFKKESKNKFKYYIENFYLTYNNIVKTKQKYICIFGIYKWDIIISIITINMNRLNLQQKTDYQTDKIG